MTISKKLAIFCAVATGALCLTVRAEDNPAQAAARAALAKQLFEMNGQSASNAAPAATETTAPAKPVSDKQAKAAAKAKAKQEAAELKARQEAEKKQAAEAKAAQQAEQKKAAEQQAAEAKAAHVAAAKAKADQAAVQVEAKQEADKKSEAERAALAAALAERVQAESQAKANAQPTNNPPAMTASAPVAAKASKKEKKEKQTDNREPSYAGKELGLKPVAAPALPISATKEQQLQALLGKYKADQISPEEYHKQRAAILAQP